MGNVILNENFKKDFSRLIMKHKIVYIKYFKPTLILFIFVVKYNLYILLSFT